MSVRALLPAVVLDPFGGAGTVALVARALGRSAVLIELNPDYVAQAEQRLAEARFAQPKAPRSRARRPAQLELPLRMHEAAS